MSKHKRDNLPMDWKTVITQVQGRHNLTQPQLAKLVGCSQAFISDLVRGRTREPRYSIGQRLLDLSKSDALYSQHPVREPSKPHDEPCCACRAVVSAQDGLKQAGSFVSTAAAGQGA